MKKILVILMATLVSSNSSAFEDLQSTPKKSLHRDKNSFLDASSKAIDEYAFQGNNQQALDEYDQNVTDHVKPPKMCAAEILFKEMVGSLFVNYLHMKELARIYFQEVKDVLSKWFTTIVKK
jgi:hypothetical protein